MTRPDLLGFVPTDLSRAIELCLPIGFIETLVRSSAKAHQGENGKKRATPRFSLLIFHRAAAMS